jgi:hypothetical protein
MVTEESAQELKNVLTLYEEVSGQTVNIAKCSIVFSPNSKKKEIKEG